MPDAPQLPSADAPAPTGPDAGPQIEVALGPDPSIYPEHLRPAPEPAAPPVSQDAPEPAETTAPERELDVAGAEPSPQEGETRGTRRRAAEDAYQRGLTEGRANLEREQAQAQQQNQLQQTQREASARVEQLFTDLEAPDYATQDRARQGILQMYRGNRQAQALMTTTRQQILQEMASDFAKLGEIEGIDADGYQSLHTAPSAADLAKRAFELGRKATKGSADEQIARLEAELQGLRGRLVGSRATPEAHNGSGSHLDGFSLEQYQALSPKDAAKLSSAQIDAMTAQMAADAQRNGR